MWSLRTSQFPWLLINLCILFSCQFLKVVSQCGHGLEPTCVWMHDPKTVLLWKMKRDPQDSFVELTKCNYPKCGSASIQTPWLSPRDTQVTTTLNYKIYGHSEVYMKLYLKLEDAGDSHTLYSTVGNYAYAFPESWTSVSVTIPATHARYKLFLKASIPYREALVAVRDINLDGSIIITISPTHYNPDVEDISTHIPDEIDDYDYFPDDDDDNEDERRFQALEVQNFIGEEDLTKGFTEVVEPKLCMFK